MDLSIVIVSWNTKTQLGACLESVFETTRGIEFEVFVVDNASTDGSPSMVRDRFASVRLIENATNMGFAYANNEALRHTTGRHILLLNSDTQVLLGSLGRMLNFMDQHATVGVLGPALLNAHYERQRSWATFPTVWTELWGIHRRHKTLFIPQAAGPAEAIAPPEAYSVDWMAGACLLVRRTAIDQVGLMDERFFLYSEETDWCHRIKQAGWQNVYYPPAEVIHYEGSSSIQDKPRTSLLLLQSKLLYAQKHFGNRRTALLTTGFFLLTLVKALVGLAYGNPSRARAQWKLARQLRAIRM